MMERNNYCKQFILTIFCIAAVLMIHAQYNVTAISSQGSIYMRSQLWDISISNTGTSTIEARLQMDMKNLQTHQTVLSAVSGSFTLPPGVKAIQSRLVEPIQYNNNGAAVSTNQSSNGFLPVGEYQVCYQLFVVTHAIRNLVADDCEQVAVEPFSPPLLIMPQDDSVIFTTTPNFTWVPPAPVAMFSNLNYDLLITEIHNGQSVNDALQKNLPLQQAQHLQQPFFSFPLQGPQLENGKRYAWQIIAKDQQQYAARSEAWSFRMGSKKEIPGLNNTVYLLIDDRTAGTGIIEPGILHLKYVSSGAAKEVLVVFKDESGVTIKTAKLLVKQGDNYLNISLNGQFKSKHTYTATITGDNGKTNLLTFTIQ